MLRPRGPGNKEWPSLAELSSDFSKHPGPGLPSGARPLFPPPWVAFPAALRWTSLPELRVDVFGRALTGVKDRPS